MQMRIVHVSEMVLGAVLWGCLFVMPTCAAESSQLEEEIHTASRAYLQALGTGDREKIAACWTKDGVFIDAFGTSVNARQHIAEQFPDGEVTASAADLPALNSTLRVLSPSLVVEHGSLRDPDGRGSHVGFLAIWSKQAGQWLLDLVRECPQPSTIASEPVESNLSGLDWLLGDWQSDDEDSKASMSVRRSDDGKYLLLKYAVALSEQEELHGEGRIAWDPANSRIRSWLFRADGALMEGTWEYHGDTWVVHENGVLPDGERVSSVNLWAFEAPDTCWFKAHRSRVGAIETDRLTLQFKRVGTAK